MAYKPKKEILDKYADLLVNFALNSGEGVKEGEIVFLSVPESAKPLLLSLRRAVLQAGAHPIIQYHPDGIAREFFEIASNAQLKFFPGKYLKGQVREADHVIGISAEIDKRELEGIQPKKIMTRSKVYKPYWDWREEKEVKGEFTWTLALYATSAMAKEAGLTLERFWNQIIKACYLDLKNPIRKWQKTQKEIERIKVKLNKLKIEKLHIKSKNTDLTIGIGRGRIWVGGSGRNIPSFEIFTSPDCRVVEGDISFNQPLYRYGNLIKGVRLKFEDGKVAEVKADQGEDILKEMLLVKGADQVGEISLTDGRLSRITKFMAETLFDENRGGRQGNVHIALGSAYKDTYPGDSSKISKKRWKAMGYNDSAIHTDLVSTNDRVVTAYLQGGKRKTIYKNGRFVI